MKNLIRPLGQRSRKLVVNLLWPVLLVWVPGSLGASDHVVRSSWRPSGETMVLEVRDGTLPIALEDAVVIALRQNLGLRIERLSRAQSLFRIQQNLGIFDLQSSVQSSASENTSASASVLDGADVAVTEFQALNIRLDQLTPFGGTASLDWSNSRRETNSTFSGVNPSFNIGMDLVFNQPLLRNFGRLPTDVNLRVARTNSAISVENLEINIVNTLQSVEDTYWGLVEAREQLKVAEESLELARNLHEMNRVQVEVGTLAPLELIQSEVGVATREEEIIRSQAAVEDNADELRRLLNLEGDQYWTLEIVPETDPESERLEIDLSAALAAALEDRPEIKTQLLQLQNREIESAVSRNQTRPRLDLNLRYGFNGLGGDLLVRDPGDFFNPDPPPPVLIPGGYGDALEQITDGLFDGWTVSVDFGYPIQNRNARAQSIIADLALEEGRAVLEDLELSIKTEVRQATRGVETAAKQIDSARVSRRLEERNLDAEQKRYENGLSTSFQVLEIQEDLTSARSREVNAITGYRRAVVRYYRSIGRLLEAHGIELDDDADEENSRP